MAEETKAPEKGKKDVAEETKAPETDELIKQLIAQNQQLLEQNTQLVGRVEALEKTQPKAKRVKKPGEIPASMYKAPVTGEYRCVVPCYHNHFKYAIGEYATFEEDEIIPRHFVPPGSKEEAAQINKQTPKLGTIVQKPGKGARTLKEIQERK